MTRIIEIFYKICEFDELPDVLKTMDLVRKSELLGTCAYLLGERMHCISSNISGIIETVELSDEFIIATIKRLLGDSEDYWGLGLEIYTAHKYRYTIMGKECYAIDESVDTILKSLSAEDLDTVVRDCIREMRLNIDCDEFVDMIMPDKFDPTLIVAKYLEKATKRDRRGRSMKIDSIRVERIG